MTLVVAAILAVPTIQGTKRMDFGDSALIGHLISFSLLTTLMRRGIISRQDASELLDETLLMLEQQQSGFPEHAAWFESARAFLGKALAELPTTTPSPPWRIP
ncbi:MAG TPA: hypothetical protein VGR45_08295 [Stellaceae bacterium]|nr:hypothetical protein [Stellaceae bacterium]